MNHLERVALFAVLAEVRLKDAASRNKLLLCVAALMALKEGLLHLGDDVGVSYYDTLYRDQLIDMRRIQVSDSVVDSHVEGPHLDNWVVVVSSSTLNGL
jgi:hypothetical protein